MYSFTVTSEPTVAPRRRGTVGKIAPALACAAALLGVGAAPAHAQLARTFVSAAVGNDANNCDRPTPCRTFQSAHDKTLANGEITVLDPGGYGAVLISRPISIINDGVGEAGVLVSGGANGITVDTGNLNPGAVSLRGLTIKGIGFGGGTGIVFFTGTSLTIENCAIRNLDGAGLGTGIVFNPRKSASLTVSKTIVTDNTGTGVNIVPHGSGTVSAVFNGVEIYNSGNDGLIVNGINYAGTIKATVTDSVSAGNGRSGFFALTNAGQATTSLTVIRSVSANNVNAGLDAEGGQNATLRFGASTITGNLEHGLVRANAVLQSYGDNYFDGNGSDIGAEDRVATR